MNPTDFVSPRPTPISNFSPSLANQLMACQLRVAFQRDPSLRSWRRPSTYTALGLAAHAVTEAAFRRKGWASEAGAIRAQLQALWDKEVEQSAASLVKAWAPAEPPPPPEWPGYALTRARTIRRATRMLSKPLSERPQPSDGTGVEVELRDPASGLFGRADRIEVDGDSTRVLDLKTGLNQADPTEDQQRQLLLYSFLVHRKTGTWPRSIAIEDATGSQCVLPLHPSEAEEAVFEAQSAVSRFNDVVDADGFVELANPSPELCRWCAFRVLCRPFWETLSSDWEQRAAMGSVTMTGNSQGGPFVVLRCESPADRNTRTLQVSGLPERLPEGTTKVAVVDWSGSAEADSVRARWSTTVRTY